MDFDDLDAERGTAGPTVFEGVFATSAASVDDKLVVRVPWLDSNQTGVPVDWQPYPGPNGPILPQARDRAWIAEAMSASGGGNGWIVLKWLPASLPAAIVYVATADPRLPQPGDLKTTARATAPTGWLLCDGASVLRADFPALFAALGGASSPYGLPDGTHFNVPDFRGRSPMGPGTGTAVGATAKTLGQKAGEETHTLSLAETPAHSHATVNDLLVNVAGGGAVGYASGAATLNHGQQATSSQGGGGAHNNLAPVQVVNFLIKT